MSILYILGMIIAFLLLVALLTPKDFSLKKQVIINKSKSEVFNYLIYLKNQEQYNVWMIKDPNIKIKYSGTDGTVGAKQAWESEDKNVGIGEQEIIKLNDNESMETEIRFKKPFEATNYAVTTLTSLNETQTNVSNTFRGTSKFPMNIMNLFMDRMVGGDMQKNLENIKSNLEK